MKTTSSIRMMPLLLLLLGPATALADRPAIPTTINDEVTIPVSLDPGAIRTTSTDLVPDDPSLGSYQDAGDSDNGKVLKVCRANRPKCVIRVQPVFGTSHGYKCYANVSSAVVVAQLNTQEIKWALYKPTPGVTQKFRFHATPIEWIDAQTSATIPGFGNTQAKTDNNRVIFLPVAAFAQGTYNYYKIKIQMKDGTNPWVDCDPIDPVVVNEN